MVCALDLVSLSSPAAFAALKSLFDTTPAKNRIPIITQAFMDDHGCDCLLSWEQCAAVVKKYQTLAGQSHTVATLIEYILTTFGEEVLGSKEFLVKIALCGISL
jgi:hypothetical protein